MCEPGALRPANVCQGEKPQVEVRAAGGMGPRADVILTLTETVSAMHSVIHFTYYFTFM